jgi:hypothetical protein
MERYKVFFLYSMVFLYIILVPIFIYSQSYRIMGMGKELSWIVEDGYTDILKNPAEVALIEKEISLNASALLFSDPLISKVDTVELTNPYFDEFIYSLEPVSISECIDRPYLLSWVLNLGRLKGFVCFDFQKHTNSVSPKYRMQGPNYNSFDWVYDDTVRAGTTTTIHDRGTSTLEDDYLVFNSRTGKIYNEDDGDIIFSFTTGGNISYNFAYGLRYAFEKYYNNADPMWAKFCYYHGYECEKYPMGRVENVEEVYRIEEIGDSSIEALDVHKKSNDDINNNIINHTVSFGLKCGIESQWSFDLVPLLKLQYKNFSNEQSMITFVDYDPDKDDDHYLGFSNDIEYESKRDIKAFNLFGYGLGFAGRLSKNVGERERLRFISNVYLSRLKDNEALEDTSYLSVFTSDNDYDTLFYNFSRKGKMQEKLNKYSFGAGIEGGISDNTLIALGGIISYTSNVKSFEFTESDSSGIDIKGTEEIISNTTTLSLPIGFESYMNDYLAFRLGIVEYLTWNTEREVLVKEMEEASKTYMYRTESCYTYGLFVGNDKIQFDIFGETDILKIKDIQVSVSFKM